MKKREITASVMVLSTMLGLALPATNNLTRKNGLRFSTENQAKADTTTDEKQADIDTATDSVNSAIERVKMDINNSTASDALKTISLDNLNKANNLASLVSDYQNGGSQSDFKSNIATTIATIDNLALPDDWVNASQLLQKIYAERTREVQVVTATDPTNINATYVTKILTKFPVSTAEEYANKGSYNSKTQLASLFGSSGTAFKSFAYSLDGVKKTDAPGASDLEFAQFILKSMADSRKSAINAQSSANDDQKAAAVQQVDDAYVADQGKLTGADVKLQDIASLLSNFYNEFEQIEPVTDYSQASSDSKQTAINDLQKAYDDATTKLKSVTGYDSDVTTALAKAKTLLDTYTAQVNTAVTIKNLNTIKSEGINKIRATPELMATDTEKAAAIKIINDAATAQKAIINADSQASDTEKATAITAVENWVKQYTGKIQAANTTVQDITTAQTGALTTIKSTTPMHSQQITTAQRNAAINAVITAGNTEKVAIQNDASIAASDKVAAYAAVDKLVTTYTDQLKAAKSATDLAKIQNTGIAAVTAYQVTKTAAVTTTDPTINNVAAPSVAKASTKKVLYAISGLKLYKSDSLKGKTVASYAKHKRTNRPTFLVTKTVKNDAGKKVYYVQNQASGKKGYITSSTKSVAYAYYQTTPKKVQVISKGGVNQYKKANLSTKQKHYKKGQTLKVKKLIKSGVTTRFQLTNGSYVSANKKFVIDTQY